MMLNLLTRKKVPGGVAPVKAGTVPQVLTPPLPVHSPVHSPVRSPVQVQAQPQVQGQAMKFKFGNGDQPLPGFTIKRGVGIGGFGEVYFATNDAGKEVALKQIQRNLDVEVRGVRQCMNLKHPNLIALYDIQFDAAEQGWIVMEYVAGMSLRDAIEAYPQGLPQPELARWFSQIVAGVAYLHDHGIVHRDLKPANIFEDQGIVKIGDYGLSKFISCSRRGGQTESVGTFHYMAPEIGRGEYGKEIDVYALGIMLYEMAMGVVPFDGESSQEIIMKHLTADPDLSQLTSPVREVVARALAKNPAARSSDVREMLQPLGWELDSRYLPIPSSLASKSSVTHVETPSASLNPPVVGARSEPPRMAGNAAQSKPQSPAYARHTAEEATAVHYQEPLAQKVRQHWMGLNRWWAQLAINPGAKTTLLVFAIIFMVLNAEVLISFLVLGLLFYVPYYAVWWTLRGPAPSARQQRQFVNRQSAPIARTAHTTQAWSPSPHAYPPLQPVVASPPVRPARPERPVSVKQWRLARRMQLAQVPRRKILSEVTGGWLGAAAVICVFSTLAALFQIGSGRTVQPLLMGTVWAALITLAMAWVAIAFGKRWQREEGDWALRAFMQLTSGFAIGGLAFLLAQYLMIPWESITREQLGELPVRRWRGFFGDDGQPLLPAYLAYFPLLMGVVGWWKQVDPLRRVRLSFWAVMWSAVAASLVHLLIPFPQPWGALIAAGTSLAIQLSSPWINPNERLQVAQV